MINATAINKGGKKVCDEFGISLFLSLCWAVFLALMTMMFLLLCSNQISPHHLDDDELLPHNNSKLFADDAMSFYSVPSSFADSASTVISFKGKSMETNCPPQQLILFLVNELKTKVKLSPGVECELLRFFREVSMRFNFPPPSQTTARSRSTSSNSIIRLSEHSPSKLWKIPTAMGWTHRTKAIMSIALELIDFFLLFFSPLNSFTQAPPLPPPSSTCTRLNDDVRSDDKQRAASTTTSKDVQTDLAASEVTKWQQFYDKYLEHQLTLNEKLEWVSQPTTMNCLDAFPGCFSTATSYFSSSQEIRGNICIREQRKERPDRPTREWALSTSGEACW